MQTTYYKRNKDRCYFLKEALLDRENCSLRSWLHGHSGIHIARSSSCASFWTERKCSNYFIYEGNISYRAFILKTKYIFNNKNDGPCNKIRIFGNIRCCGQQFVIATLSCQIMQGGRNYDVYCLFQSFNSNNSLLSIVKN